MPHFSPEVLICIIGFVLSLVALIWKEESLATFFICGVIGLIALVYTIIMPMPGLGADVLKLQLCCVVIAAIIVHALWTEVSWQLEMAGEPE